MDMYVGLAKSRSSSYFIATAMSAAGQIGNDVRSDAGFLFNAGRGMVLAFRPDFDKPEVSLETQIVNHSVRWIDTYAPEYLRDTHRSSFLLFSPYLAGAVQQYRYLSYFTIGDASLFQAAQKLGTYLGEVLRASKVFNGAYGQEAQSAIANITIILVGNRVIDTSYSREFIAAVLTTWRGPCEQEYIDLYVNMLMRMAPRNQAAGAAKIW